MRRQNKPLPPCNCLNTNNHFQKSSTIIPPVSVSLDDFLNSVVYCVLAALALGDVNDYYQNKNKNKNKTKQKEELGSNKS